MCLDSPARKQDLHKPVTMYPCHKQGGNQVTEIKCLVVFAKYVVLLRIYFLFAVCACFVFPVSLSLSFSVSLVLVCLVVVVVMTISSGEE